MRSLSRSRRVWSAATASPSIVTYALPSVLPTPTFSPSRTPYRNTFPPPAVTVSSSRNRYSTRSLYAVSVISCVRRVLIFTVRCRAHWYTAKATSPSIRRTKPPASNDSPRRFPRAGRPPSRRASAISPCGEAAGVFGVSGMVTAPFRRQREGTVPLSPLCCSIAHFFLQEKRDSALFTISSKFRAQSPASASTHVT